MIFPIDDKITSSKLTRLMRGPPEFPTYKITEKPHYKNHIMDSNTKLIKLNLCQILYSVTENIHL